MELFRSGKGKCGQSQLSSSCAFFITPLCCPILFLHVFEALELHLVILELFLDLGCPIEKLSCCTMDLSFDVKLVTLDSECRSLSFGQDESLLGHVLLDLLHGDVDVGDAVRLAELVQVLRQAGEASLNLKDVQKSLTADLTGVRSE